MPSKDPAAGILPEWAAAGARLTRFTLAVEERGAVLNRRASDGNILSSKHRFGDIHTYYAVGTEALREPSVLPTPG